MTMLDLHTHHHGRHDAVINLRDGESPADGYIYSAGVHPWDTIVDDDEIERRLARVAELVRLPHVVAIGEAGLDKLRGASPERQAAVLRRQVELSESARKPMILHVVKAFPEIMALRKSLKPTQQWIIHGFRGKPQLAESLLRAGFDISLGEYFNPASAAIIPPSRLFAETDESLLPIEEIVDRMPLKPEGVIKLSQ